MRSKSLETLNPWNAINEETQNRNPGIDNASEEQWG